MAVELTSVVTQADNGTVKHSHDNTAYDGEHVVSHVNAPVKNEKTDHEAIVTISPAGNDNDVTRHNAYHQCLISVKTSIARVYTVHEKVIWTFIGILLALGYFAYFGFAMYYRFGDEGSFRLLGYTSFGVALFVIVTLGRVYDTQLDSWWRSTENFRNSSACNRFTAFIKWFLRVGVLVTLVVYVVMDIALDNPGNLLTVAGLALYLFVFYVTSVNPAKINWHTVFWGMALQYVFALVILRTSWGYWIFQWLGERVTGFMEYAVAGALFVFGESYEDHFFAMKVMSIVVFFFTVINVLFYLGVIQAIIRVIGRFLAFCMGTTPAESLNAGANIFLGLLDGPLLIRPFLKHLTKSELHAIMTSGFATIAGSVLGAYISFGVPANHLISASVMSAPAALAISKLSYPETEESVDASNDYSKMEKPPEHNIIEAVSNGATGSVKMIGAIIVNLIAFLSILAFVNASLTWFGNRVGIEDLKFQHGGVIQAVLNIPPIVNRQEEAQAGNLICSYVLYPLSYFMGVETADCRKVAELVGVKTFTNEFIAYTELKGLIANRHSLDNYTEFFNTTDWYWHKGDVALNITGEILKGGVMSVKSEVIATYALCGFANFGSIGITLGALGALAPTRKTDISNMIMRAMICGNFACFLTACVAGLLYKPF